MKKYVKPMLTLERFELSQNIANCAWELNLASQDDCVAYADKAIFGDMNGFLFTKARACTYKTDDGYEDYCYQNGGSSPFNVFMS